MTTLTQDLPTIALSFYAMIALIIFTWQLTGLHIKQADVRNAIKRKEY